MLVILRPSNTQAATLKYGQSELLMTVIIYILPALSSVGNSAYTVQLITPYDYVTFLHSLSNFTLQHGEHRMSHLFKGY